MRSINPGAFFHSRLINLSNHHFKNVEFTNLSKKQKRISMDTKNSNLNRSGGWLEETFGLKNAKIEDMLSDAVLENGDDRYGLIVTPA